MKNKLQILTISFIVAIIAFSSAFAASKSDPIDKYYTGLSEVIEKYSKNPDKCIKKVESFLSKNGKLIAQVKSARNSTLEQAKEGNSQLDTSNQILDAKTTPQARFNNAMKKLSRKDPESGKTIMALHSRALFSK